MKAEELVKDKRYFVGYPYECVMVYAGTQTYQNRTYYNFYDPVLRLFHWIDPKDVKDYFERNDLEIGACNLK